MWRWLPLLIIIAAAFAYYGSYWKYWFNPHDEGGTACLVAQRLMQGERPWVDLDPGYNLGWFYPLVGLFKITGVNYLAARAWFFALATITALLGCYTATRVSGSRWLGLGVGLALIALPGSQFKNYIPLAQAANTACLIALVYLDPNATRRWLRATAFGGLVLGLTFLVRIELGFFFSAIWLGVLLLSLLDRRALLRRRFTGAMAGLVCLAGGVLVAQAPAYFHLRAQGLATHFISEYASWFGFLRTSLANELSSPQTPVAATVPAAPVAEVSTPVTAAPLTTAAPVASLNDRTILLRRPLSEMWTESGKKRLLPFLTYAPFVSFAVVLLIGIYSFFRALARRQFQLDAPAVLWPLLTGAALTTFPQFFFFRPDRPHLSEFMPGFIVAMAAALWLLWRRDGPRARFRTVGVSILAGFLALHFAAYATYAMQHPSSGTIAARFRGKTWFHGENGVHCRGTKREAAEFTMVHDAAMKHSREGDYLICFPYMPGYNVMTNRRTYLYNVYVDNATRSENFAVKTIRDFENKKPALVAIDNRAINGIDSSRFSHWAATVVDYLRAHYTSVGKFEDIEVFARPATPPAP
jgi:hypothetical protein